MASLADAISKRFEILNTAIEHLEELRAENFTRDDLSNDWRLQSIVAKQLQVAIQAIIDIGNMIIAEMGFEVPKSNANIS